MYAASYKISGTMHIFVVFASWLSPHAMEDSWLETENPLLRVPMAECVEPLAGYSSPR